MVLRQLFIYSMTAIYIRHKVPLATQQYLYDNHSRQSEMASAMHRPCVKCGGHQTDGSGDPNGLVSMLTELRLSKHRHGERNCRAAGWVTKHLLDSEDVISIKLVVFFCEISSF
jgi:hypothetical protein